MIFRAGEGFGGAVTGRSGRSLAELERLPDAIPLNLPINKASLRPYIQNGRKYVPIRMNAPYKARGLASWYGRGFHGKRTASGEIFDMYAMTAANPFLPLPSFARVTLLRNGKSIVVKINDRGPFRPGRVIDLSYAAAAKLGILEKGSEEVIVERVFPQNDEDS